MAEHCLSSFSGRAISPKAPISAVPDRSEIGPYRGGGSSQECGSCYRLAKARQAPGVGRFLRKRQCLRRRTARRSVPTSEAVRVRNAGLATGRPRSGELRGEGDFSESANVCGAGPLGDRSLPRRRFGSGTRVLRQAGQGLVSSGGRAISPKAPISAVPDRSEIGPYLGGLRTTFRGAHPPVRDAAIETVPAKRPFPLWGMLQGDRDPDSRRTSTAQSGRAVEGSRSV